MTRNISLINSHFTANLVADCSEAPTAAYVHLPFCRRRCYYCDFPISVVGDRETKSASKMTEEYLTALVKDIRLTPAVARPLQTVFFGGGTPSLLSPRQLEQIIQAIASHFGLACDAEISIEIDPGTFNREKLVGYRDAGINRFSLGVQSFDEKLLKICGRSHNLSDVMQAVNTIEQLGIKNFSLDLISGLPHQTLQHCQASLEQAIAIAPPHLSCYDLVLEPVTAFGKQYQPGKTPLPDDDVTAQMYRLTQQTLTAAGYEHYEVSNYARPGYQCRHNRVYWKNQPYYGFGMGASSYVGGKRFSRPRTRREYYAWIEAGATVDVAKVSATDYLLETLMLGLRLAEGVDLAQFSTTTIQAICCCIKPYYAQGWIEIVGQNGLIKPEDYHSIENLSGKLRFKDPEGFLFSNTVLAALFEKLE